MSWGQGRWQWAWRNWSRSVWPLPSWVRLHRIICSCSRGTWRQLRVSLRSTDRWWRWTCDRSQCRKSTKPDIFTQQQRASTRIHTSLRRHSSSSRQLYESMSAHWFSCRWEIHTLFCCRMTRSQYCLSCWWSKFFLLLDCYRSRPCSPRLGLSLSHLHNWTDVSWWCGWNCSTRRLRLAMMHCCRPWPLTRQHRKELGFLLPRSGGICQLSTRMWSISSISLCPGLSSSSTLGSESISPVRFLLRDSWRSLLLSGLLSLSLESPNLLHRRASFQIEMRMRHFCPQRWSSWPSCSLLWSWLRRIIFPSSSCQPLWNVQTEDVL